MKRKIIGIASFILSVATIVTSSIAFAMAESRDEKEYKESIPLYEVSSNNSSVEWGAFESVNMVEGIKVQLFSGDTFVYNRPIDLRGFTSADSLIEAVVVPTVFGEADMGSLQIILTDVYDASNSVVVDFHECSGVSNMTYVSAAATGQPQTGRENGDKIHRSNSYGQWCWMNFSSNITDNMISHEENLVALAYNFEENSVNLYKNGSTKVFADFDSADYFQTVWGGFTTGEVFLSVKCGMYAKSYANFVIKSIANHDITQTTYIDNEKPIIKVDYDGYDDALPIGVVDCEYPIFNAEATDNLDGNLPVKVRIYRNYYMYNKVSVTTNGKSFYPTDTGKYYIEYSTVDAFGNIGNEVVEIEVEAESSELVVQIDEQSVSGYVGELISLPNYTANGGSGRISIEKKVTLQGKECEIVDDQFRPYKAGAYQFRVIATDYVGQQQEAVVEIEVEVGEKPVYIEKVQIPKYFLLNKVYHLPQMQAYDFSEEEGISLPSKIYEQKGGERTEITNEYIPTTVGDVEIVYQATNEKNTSEVIYYAKVVDVSDGDDGLILTNYFEYDNMQAESTENYIALQTEKGTGSAEFILPLSRYDVNVEFGVDADKQNFERFNIYFISYYNPDKFIKFTYKNKGGGRLCFIVNDVDELSTDIIFTFNGTYNFFNINGKKGTASPDSMLGTKTTVDKYYDGTFVSYDLQDSLCYVKFEIEGAIGASAVKLRNLAGQAMSSEQYDIIEPYIYLERQQIGDKDINSAFTLNPALVVDVLDPQIEAYVSVVRPDNSYVIVNGQELNKVSVSESYQFTFDSYGQYKVIYYAVDSSGNVNNISGFIIHIIDEVAPEIKIKGKVSSEVTLGKSIYVPKMTAVDNYDKNVECICYVVTPNGMYYVLEKDSDGFTPNEIGVYRIRYVAIDQAGNMTLKEYSVTVKEKS